MKNGTIVKFLATISNFYKFLLNAPSPPPSHPKLLFVNYTFWEYIGDLKDDLIIKVVELVAF